MARVTKARKTVGSKVAASIEATEVAAANVMDNAAIEAVMNAEVAELAADSAAIQAAVEDVKEPGAKPAARSKKNQPARIQLPARLQINNLDGLYADLCKLVTGKKDHVVLDAGEVSLVDSAGVQLLVAFFRSFQTGGGKVEWDNYSVQLYQMADELGVSGQLGG